MERELKTIIGQAKQVYMQHGSLALARLYLVHEGREQGDDRALAVEKLCREAKSAIPLLIADCG